MIWILRILNILLLILDFLVIFYKPNFTRIVFIAISLLFLISGLRKAFTIGLDNLRGKFWVLLSLNGLIFPIAAFYDSQIVHALGRFYLIFPLTFMFLGLKRQGLSLKGIKTIIWLLIVILVIILSNIFLLVNKDLLTLLFVIVLNINFAILLANVLIYFGSDLGRRWLIGFLAFSFLLIGDPLYIFNMKDWAYFFWCFIFFFLNIIAHIEE